MIQKNGFSSLILLVLFGIGISGFAVFWGVNSVGKTPDTKQTSSDTNANQTESTSSSSTTKQSPSPKSSSPSSSSSPTSSPSAQVFYKFDSSYDQIKDEYRLTDKQLEILSRVNQFDNEP